MKFKEWDGEPLKGTWIFTIKMDGIQVKRKVKKTRYIKRFDFEPNVTSVRSIYTSKNDNPLAHMQNVTKEFEVGEVFRKNWNETWSVVSAHKSDRIPITNEEIYTILPNIDERLYLGTFTNPTVAEIKEIFGSVVTDGHEGLVLRQGEVFIKVKTVYTKDIKITGFVEGKGKFEGMLGKFTTDEGDCGTGYTNQERKDLWKIRKKMIGVFIEVKSMETTKNGKLRNPRFVRVRLDK